MCADKRLWSALISRYETGALRLQSTVTTSFVQPQVFQIYFEDPRSISSSESFCRTRVLNVPANSVGNGKARGRTPSTSPLSVHHHHSRSQVPSLLVPKKGFSAPRAQGATQKKHQDNVGDGCIKAPGPLGLNPLSPPNPVFSASMPNSLI